MRFFIPFQPQLRDRADEGEGSSRIDPGAAHFHTTDPEPAGKAPPVEKSDLEKRLDSLEADLKKRDDRIAELTESERYWANRNREQPKPSDDGAEDEENRLPIRATVDEKPEKLLDDLSTQGLKALAERGVITEEKLAEILDAQEKRFNGRLSEAQDGAAFDAKLGKEFPEITDPKSDLFKKAQVHFREMVGVDPRAKNSRSALWAAAKMAKNEIAAEAATNTNKNREDAESRRRDRIDRQRGERDTGGDRDDGEKSLTPTQREIMGRLGVTEEQFFAGRDQLDRDGVKVGRNGRGR